jgi:hypothetical protein
MAKTTALNENELKLKNLLLYLETQRDLQIRLTLLLEKTKQCNEDKNIVLGVATRLAQLRGYAKADFVTLTKEEKIIVNRMLKSRNLRL